MLTTVVIALVPVAALIALGSALRHAAVLPDTFWPAAERLGYYVLLPALFLHGLGTADLGALPVATLAAVLVSATLLTALALVAVRPALAIDGAAFTSVFQGGVRFNNYVGLSLAAALFGAEGIAYAGVANAAIVPTVNVLCVLVFARYGQGAASLGTVVRQLATNPLILACLFGIGLQALGLRLPPGLDESLRALGLAALPLGLLCAGAALRFGAVRTGVPAIAVASAAKFVVLPAATALACAGTGLAGPAAAVAILVQALPTATSSTVLARQLGGDVPLMAGILAAQTLLAAAVLPALLMLAM